MKYLALAAILFAVTAAHAKPAWQYTPSGLDGQYTEQRINWYGHPYDQTAIIAKSYTRLQATEEVVSTITNELDEAETVTNQVPLPVSESYFAIGMDAPRAATDEEMAARATAAAQAAQAAQIAALSQAKAEVGGLVSAIRANLVALGYDLPCNSSEVMGEIIAKSLGGQLTAEQERAKGDLADLYIMLTGRGVSDDDIANVWAYIAAGGQ